MNVRYNKKLNEIIFASSCVESAAKKKNISTKEMYERMNF